MRSICMNDKSLPFIASEPERSQRSCEGGKWYNMTFKEFMYAMG